VRPGLRGPNVNLIDLQHQFAENLSLRLLRAENAPLILATLHAAFKHEHQPSVSESRLRALLESEIAEARENSRSSHAKSAKEYLVEWADPNHGYLHRFQPKDTDEPAYELTPEIEKVFQWLESLKPRPHVGTESKFKSLASTLSEIIENSTREPEKRIERLRAEQLRLQEQIDEIERTGIAPLYNATQINERFQYLLEISRQLLGDFREVERHFRIVTEKIVIHQSDTASTRGGIVSQTLDAQDRLRQSSQGQSFYAFWEFLLAFDRRREFNELVEKAYRLQELSDQLRGDSILRGLQLHLRIEGSKVLASNERLVAQLRRILDIRQSAERREVGRVLQDIKALAHQSRDQPAQTEWLDIDGPPVVFSVMSKAHWTPPTFVEFGGDLELAEGGDYHAALQSFLQLHPIDFDALRANIRTLLQSRVQVSLPELLAVHPPRNGILEVLAYLVIAESDGPHAVFAEFDLIELPDAPGRTLRIPRVVFSNT
jgi:hypothetical protein